jgi:hypothetical protein
VVMSVARYDHGGSVIIVYIRGKAP